MRSLQTVRGFTLPELMLTVAIASLLTVMAIPSLRSMLARQGAISQVNDLVGALNYARHEAIRRGSPIYLCPGQALDECNQNNDWSHGWTVYRLTSTGPEVLRVQSYAGNGPPITANGKGPMSFNASGFAIIGRSFTFSLTRQRLKHVVSVASTGRVIARRHADE